ncbi:MAG: AmmeMemoRadiSam system protein B [Kiritimatiellia bacterium]|jgi:AmmeMemoRadiSam system protein B/AmmeMemoRadiSam system protein A|nr:AmmeMemoRadiSam system protein B [Lentisphaerota bacterium]
MSKIICVLAVLGMAAGVTGIIAQEGESVMTKNCVESTLAGSWYDANPVRLKAELEGYLEHAQIDADESIVAVVVPHAGYAYSGLCAAHGVKALAARKNLRRVVVVGFSHRIAFANQASIPLRETCFRSPLGETELDTEALAALGKNALFTDLPATRRGENSVELIVPLLQAALAGREWRLAPITLGQLNPESREGIARALKELCDGATGFVFSSDFTHYGPNFGYVPFRKDVADRLRALDGGAIAKILGGDVDGFHAYCAETGATICGQDSIGVLLRMLPEDFTARELSYDTSGNISGDFKNSVSYASLGFYWADGATEKGEKEEAETSQGEEDVIPEADQKALLALARKSIEMALDGKPPSKPEDTGVELTPAMQRVMGGFVTLNKDGDLRGCIGEIFPRNPLGKVVMANALNAAFHDPRFPPLRAKELADVSIEISALTPPAPVASYHDIVIGKHGMVLQVGFRSAVFLPQVATEQGWDLATTLSYLARKAGLPADAWKLPEAKFTVFEAIIFRE